MADVRNSHDLDKDRRPAWATPFRSSKPWHQQNLGDRMREQFERDRREESDEVEGKDLEYIKNFKRDLLVTFRIKSIEPSVVKNYSDAQIRNTIDAFILKGEWAEYAGGSTRVYMKHPDYDDEDYDSSIVLEVQERWPSEKAVDATKRKVLIPKKEDDE